MSQPFRTFVKNFGIFIAALLAVLGWAFTTGWSVVDHRFVHVDSFAIHQAGEAALHLRDSLVVDAKLTRIDTSLAALVRACHRKGECP